MFTFRSLIITLTFVVATTAQSAFAEPSKKHDAKSIERGRYLVVIGGCNDCHTTGYAEAAGNLPEDKWLMGDQLGFRGPWGTSYPKNLRLIMQTLSEDEWLKHAKSKTFQALPPMPWYQLNSTTAQDLRAIYRFVRHLGSAGVPAPAHVPPDQESKGPFILFPAH